MPLIFKHTVAIQAASVTHHVYSSQDHDQKETLRNHTESYRAQHTTQYDFKAIMLTAYGPPKKKTLRTVTGTFGYKCQIKERKNIFVGHIMNNTYIVFYLCILNYNTLTLIVPVLGW